MDDWNDLAPQPTSLIALWPHAEPPALVDVIGAFAERLGEAGLLEELPPEDPAIAWSAAIALPLPPEPAPVVVWVEPAQPMTEDDRDALGAPVCTWVIGVQMQLDRSDPLTVFHHLVDAVASAFPEIPAILDVDTTRWYPRVDLDNIFAKEGLEPEAGVLWTIQLVEGPAPREDAEPCVWLHTHGLSRCGRPELEMIEVPVSRAAAAADLMQDVAGLLLERAVPPSGAPFEIGADLLVTLNRWRDVAPFVPDGVPGGMSDREGAHAAAHAADSAVICAAAPEGTYRKVWVWPREAIERRAGDEATVYATSRATERQAALARGAWASFVEAFAARTDAVRFGVKAGFPDDHDRGREHLWFEVCQAEPDRVEGRLLHEPVAVQKLHEGDRTWIELDQVFDWRVVTARGSVGPGEAEHLAVTLKESVQAP